jgi:DNA-binding CsgD family transcriptional regulator
MRKAASVALLERAGELEEIRTAANGARKGRGGVLLVEGEAGIGKTRLVTAARDILQRAGARVLGARGSELERTFGFGIVRQLFEPLLIAARRAERSRMLAGAAMLAAPLFDPAGGAATEAADSLLHGLYWLTANISEQSPVLLAVDDAHWADEPSLRFVDYLARRIEGLPILVVLAYRQVGAQLERTLVETLKEEPVIRVLRPAPLSLVASSTLVRAAMPSADDPFCATCHEASGGNPFLLNELVVELEAHAVEPAGGQAFGISQLAPEAVRRSVITRLDRLPKAASEVAEAAAILERARMRETAELAGLSLEETARAADELTAIGVLGSVDPVEFAHPLLRSAVYAEIPHAERSIRHLRAAELLAERGSSRDDIAAHLMLAEPSGDPWVIDVLLAAADAAGARGASEARATYLRRVLAEPLERDRRFELLLELGNAEVAAGMHEGLDRLQSVFDAAERPVIRTDAALALARALTMAGETRRAAELLAQGMDELLPTSSDDAKRLGAELIVVTDVDLNAASFVADRLARAERMAREGPVNPATLAHEAVLLLESGDSAERAVAAAQQALADGTLFELAMAGSQYFLLTVFVLVCADRFDDAQRHHDHVIAESRARGLAAPFVIGSAQRGYVHARQGSLEEAEADAYAGFEVARLNNWMPFELMALLPLVVALTERDPRSGMRLVLEADVALDQIEHAQAAVLMIARGRLRLELGDMAGAAEDLLEGGKRFVDWGVVNPGAFDWRSSAAQALLAIGHRDRAHELAREEVERARRWGTPRAIGIALRGQGLVEGGADGVDLLREAVSVLEGSQARLEHARALTELGAAFRRANHRTEARAPLREGLELARRCGATMLANRAVQELAAAGARPRRERLTGIEALTPTERRIALLAVEGKSNPEIAQDLFVTRKTVEFHLSNAYRKLGIHSREELAGALEAETKD